jgi:hypothetical protein
MAALTQAQLGELLVGLTDAVNRLAEHTAPEPITTGVTEADRIRERVAFSYRALGTLTGRVSTTGTAFDVPVVGAFRGRRCVLLTRLVAGANFAELRTGTRTEVLKIHTVNRRTDRDDDIEALEVPVDVDALCADQDWADADSETSAVTPAAGDTSGGSGDADVPDGDRAAGPVDPDGLRRRFGRVGVIRPEVFVESDPIGSIVVMRSRLGPLVAFGPRLPACPPRPIHSPM